MTSDPNDPNRPFEYPSLEQSGPVDPYAPIDYPSAYPPPPPQAYPTGFPPPYQPYGANPYDPYGVGRPQGTNGQAIGALISSIIGAPLCFCFIPSIVGIVLGIVAMNETKRTGQQGHGMALAAVIVGGISIAFGVVIMIIGAVAPDSDNTY